MNLKVTGEARQVGLNTIFNTIGGVLIQLLTIATGVFVARHFGAENFGQLTLAATITGYFTLVTEFGLSTIAIRVVARTDEPERYIYSYLVVRISLAFLALIILAGIMAVMRFPLDTAWLLVAYAVTIPLQVLKVNWLFYAKQQMFYDNILQIAEKVAYAVCLFSLMFFIKWIILVPVAMIISILIVTALGWALFLRRYEKPVVWKLDQGFIGEIITQGWPVGVAGASLRVNTNADSIFVNAYFGDMQTGLYGAAYRLINAIITAGTFFTNAVFPLACKHYQESVPALADFISYASKLLLLVTVPSVVLLSVMSEEIIALIFGQGYADSAMPFRLLVWAAGIAIICRLYHNTLVACDCQYTFMKIILASAVFNIICNFLLIPSYGMIGAAVATLLTELLLFILAFAALGQVFRLQIWCAMGSIIGCAGVASVVFLLPLPVLAKPPLFLACYFIAIIVFRVWGEREWHLVQVMLDKGKQG
jgi:O-antigen/teichoic acid export membrane protein